MKKIIFGLIIGLILGVTTTVYAATIASNSFLILVNNEVKNIQAYNIDGYTYLKLADVGNALGAEVKFNQNTKQIEITSLMANTTTDGEVAKMEESIKIESYYYRSSVIDLSGLPTKGKNYTINYGGEVYVVLSAFYGKSSETYTTEMTFNINGNETIIPFSNTDYFLMHNGLRFVKLSALGLTGTIDGDILDIE